MRNLHIVEQEFQDVDRRDAPQGTQAIDRAAQLLTLVLDSDEPLGVGDLALAAELPKSTASRLGPSRERPGLVRRNGARGKVQPGPAILRFAHRGVVERNLVELCQAPLAALAAASGETVNVAVTGTRGVEHLAQVDSRHFLGTGQWVGRTVDYHTTAVGKVLVAYGAAELPAGRLKRLAPATIVERPTLARDDRGPRHARPRARARPRRGLRHGDRRARAGADRPGRAGARALGQRAR